MTMRLNEKDRDVATQAMLQLTRILRLSKHGYSTMGGYYYKAGSEESLDSIRRGACRMSALLVQLLSGGGQTEQDVELAEFPHSLVSARGWINDLASRRTVLDDLVDAVGEVE